MRGIQVSSGIAAIALLMSWHAVAQNLSAGIRPVDKAAEQVIVTIQQDWAQMPAKWQDQFVRDMQDIGALDQTDKISYKGAPQAVMESNAGGLKPQKGQNNSNVQQDSLLSLRRDFCIIFVAEKFKNPAEKCPEAKDEANLKSLSEYCQRQKRCDGL